MEENNCIIFFEELLKEKALRQHTFDWLRGDTGRRLCVDAFFPKENLVLEYRGEQHDIQIAHFNRRPGRSAQRIRYDALRKKLIPEQGIKFLEISWKDKPITKAKLLLRLSKMRSKGDNQ